MQALILVIHVLAALCIIGLVLMQHGRGADVGASFGSGSANTMFGSAGALPFLMKVTAIFATIFFLTSISLSYLASRSEHKVMPVLTVQPAQTAKTPVPVSTDDADAGLSFAPSVKK